MRLHQIENHPAWWSHFVLFQSLLLGDLFWLSRECKGLKCWICHLFTSSLIRKSQNSPDLSWDAFQEHWSLYINRDGHWQCLVATRLLGLLFLDLLSSRVFVHLAQVVQKEELPAFPLVQSDFSSPAYFYDFELTFMSKHVPLILLMVSVAICWTRWLYHKLRPTQRWTVMKRGCQVPSSGDGGCHPKHDDQACQNWCTKAHDGGTKQNQWGLEL